jgi:hypothetical protein
MHIREFGLFCIRLQEPVQHPLLLVGSVQLTMYDGRSETYPSEFDAMSEAILATYRIDGALASPPPAEPLVPKTLYFTTISVPTDCTETPLEESGVWRCSVTLGADVNLDVQLDEMLVPMEQISNRIWTNEGVVAVLTGPFFQNWMQGATASTPGAMTRWQIVADEDLPAGMAACNDYRFDRHQSGAHLHIVEIGRFCVMTRNPVQWPYVLIGSVSLLDHQARGGPFADSDMARAEAILSTYQRASP